MNNNNGQMPNQQPVNQQPTNQPMNQQPTNQPMNQQPSPSMSDSAYEKEFSGKEFKKTKKPLIIILLIIILLLAGVAIYYFLIDTPDKVFKKVVSNFNTTLTETTSSKNTENIDFDLGMNLTTTGTYSTYTDILNNLKISGKIGTDENNIKAKINATYSNESLLNVTYQQSKTDTSKAYVKFDDILDKVILVSLEESESEYLDTELSLDTEEYKLIYESYMKAFEKALENAKYSKNIVKENDQYVKIAKLTIDKNFVNELIKNLLSDDEFLEAFAKISGETKQEVSDTLNYYIESTSSLEDFDISIYLSLLTNKFISVKLSIDDYEISITNNDNKYEYNIKSSNQTVITGYYKQTKDNDKISFEFNISIPLAMTSATINMNYNLNGSGIEDLDISKAVELSEEDSLKIYEGIMSSKGLLKLYDDLGYTEEDLEF